MEIDSLLEDFQAKRKSWSHGFQLWRAIYYGGNTIAISLPLILATDLLPNGAIYKIMLLITMLIRLPPKATIS
jgi:hypothetical protein